MSRRARLDRVCADAVELAREAAAETGEGIGEHLGAEAEAERVVTHLFECLLPGYRGWRWAVVVARAPRSRTVTVSETALLPGPDALVAPEWVPWSQRLRAGDVGVGDLLPTAPDDPRLDPAYVYSDDDGLEDLAFELGVGRERVMNREGRAECADRWYAGDRGPTAEIATSAPADARCASCGFFLPLAGSLRQVFGVCGNVYASDDARVVSSDHGCGAHSEVLSGEAEAVAGAVDHAGTVYDDNVVERVEPETEADAPDEPAASEEPPEDEESPKDETTAEEKPSAVHTEPSE
ncbi:MAG TPA: DUF3027 domain-containing protein [Stackebrandtia sp.]|jgi:hypothetical protein|uniref:DUF3027 domain-containing protein n=1 Tax=Stackebrandtia sp. TaxID=2023065 RepID=UPI002D4CBDFC|nr:DUF3027 domain-containing protein [Stackebrandtia sp.]HZE40952.1 DUF3027 domain-containing protein [Stackebrandtia sp.]